jgi:hypothetical protein
MSSNKRQAPIVTHLVATAATSSTGALVGTGSALNIANGEVALLSTDDVADKGQLTATPDGNVIKIVQGTPASSNINLHDPWGAGDPISVETNPIKKAYVKDVRTVNYTSGQYSASVYTTTTTFATNTDYGMIVELDGRRQERYFGENTDQPSASIETTGTLPTDAKDFVFQNLGLQLNSQSVLAGGSKNFVVLGMNVAGGAGTALSALVNDNSQIDFMVQNGATLTLTSDTPLVRTLADLIANSALTAASTIEVLDSVTPGSAATIDALVVVGLDAKVAVAEDDMIDVRTEVNINPSRGLENEGTVVSVYGAEAEGAGRSISIANDLRAQLQIHTPQLTPYGEYFAQGYKYINKDVNYGQYIIEYYDVEKTIDHTYEHPKTAVILWPQTEPITLSVDGVAGGTTAIGVFTPTEAAPAVVTQFATWAGV